MNKISTFLFSLSIFIFLGCSTTNQDTYTEEDGRAKVKLSTSKGDIILALYNETPLHRDNFIKIVEEGVLDSLLFHRVIESFMIQGGDTESKYAQPGDTLGNGDLPYEIQAEITPELFHKKGVLAAARGGHPDRVSSSTQFYIVQGKIFNDSLLDVAETRINGWLAGYYLKHDSLYQEQIDSLYQALDEEDWQTFMKIDRQLNELAKEYTNFDPYKIPEEHREVYKSLGGTPHLDQNYTVFGEVISGIEVVDSIAAVPTSELDRPLKDVRILKAIVMEE